VAFGTNCRNAPVPFIFLRHYCTQMRVDLFCFLDAANFFWTTIALAPSPVWPARPNSRERRPSRLVAMAAKNRLTFCLPKSPIGGAWGCFSSVSLLIGPLVRGVVHQSNSPLRRGVLPSHRASRGCGIT
jgi:hypothetical protein